MFGPVLHVVRWQRDELDALFDDIAGNGTALTLGIHSRIEGTVARVVARLANGNVYVNRNMIGAVVGTQPFGGSGLSGTGPKAGGPNYLQPLRAGAGGDGQHRGRRRQCHAAGRGGMTRRARPVSLTRLFRALVPNINRIDRQIGYSAAMTDSIARLYDAVIAARGTDPAKSRTARLLHAGRAKMAKKLAEEAVEVVIDAMHGQPRRGGPGKRRSALQSGRALGTRWRPSRGRLGRDAAARGDVRNCRKIAKRSGTSAPPRRKVVAAGTPARPQAPLIRHIRRSCE